MFVTRKITGYPGWVFGIGRFRGCHNVPITMGADCERAVVRAGCDGVGMGVTGWVEVRLHRFSARPSTQWHLPTGSFGFLSEAFSLLGAPGCTMGGPGSGCSPRCSALTAHSGYEKLPPHVMCVRPSAKLTGYCQTVYFDS